MNIKEKIDLEFKNGLRFKATNRLRSLIQENPNQMELWNTLAEYYYESGFLDAAGKYWILTEPSEERIKQCVEIYEKSVNFSGYQILQEIVFRGDKTKLSKYAQQKLTALELDSKEKMKFIPKFNPKINIKHKNNQKHSMKEKWIEMIGPILLLIIIFLLIVGFVTVIKWIL